MWLLLRQIFQRIFYISGGTLFSKCGNIWWALTTTDAAMKKTFDSLPDILFDKYTPGTGCVEQLGDSDWPEDGLQSLLTHAVGSQDSQRVQSLCTWTSWSDDITDMVRCWQTIHDCDAENFNRRFTYNICHRQWCCNLTLSSAVRKHDFFRLFSI